METLRMEDPGDYSFRISELRALLHGLKDKGKRIVFQWTPAHCGIEGNERADIIAKEAVKMAPVQPPQYSLAKCRKAAADKF